MPTTLSFSETHKATLAAMVAAFSAPAVIAEVSDLALTLAKAKAREWLPNPHDPVEYLFLLEKRFGRNT